MKNVIILLAVFLLTKISSAQKAVVTVDKIPCKEDVSGYYLEITLKKGDRIWIRTTKDYYMESLLDEGLTNEDRLEVVRALKPCFTDYAQSCKKVSRYYINSFQIEYENMPIPTSRNYNIAIDAMFALNRLFCPSYLHHISTYPVLFNSKTLKEANNDPKLIKQMSNRYLKLFQKKEKSTSNKNPFITRDDLNYLNQGPVKWWDMMIVEKSIRQDI
ncbi:hypothetical protein D3C87_1262370 [compost metagenome]|uniref:hypothetical protein n=1 Tax=Sphingobacterium faecium TaxID=34087 RepID=UPI000F99D5EB|nr:hypothetical protein [Sphingobacterium faecium]MQP26888.1 hypothetical protein [Sphingobacterium faecium]